MDWTAGRVNAQAFLFIIFSIYSWSISYKYKKKRGTYGGPGMIEKNKKK